MLRTGTTNNSTVAGIVTRDLAKFLSQPVTSLGINPADLATINSTVAQMNIAANPSQAGAATNTPPETKPVPERTLTTDKKPMDMNGFMPVVIIVVVILGLIGAVVTVFKAIFGKK